MVMVVMVMSWCRALSSKLLAPLQSKIEEWKRTTSNMDREHEKGEFVCEFVCVTRVMMCTYERVFGEGESCTSLVVFQAGVVCG